MATDEEPSKTYPEMIMEAIEALNEKNGSNKSAISKYIETKYGELPPSHSSLLTAHLSRMRESGELLFIKNNYFRPGPDVPPKRGRGRPPKPKPKPKPELPTGAVLPQPRPRGRPPPKDPLAAAVAKATAGLPRRRGRPPKAARSAASGTAAPAAAAAGNGVKRGRGRPPKVKPALVTDVV